MRVTWFIAVSAVVIGSLLPGGCAPLEINDKILHFLAYAVLASMPAWSERLPRSVTLFIGLAALGVGLEFLQLMVPGRSCEFWDAVADIMGVVFGFLVMRTMRTGASSGTPA